MCLTGVAAAMAEIVALYSMRFQRLTARQVIAVSLWCMALLMRGSSEDREM